MNMSASQAAHAVCVECGGVGGCGMRGWGCVEFRGNEGVEGVGVRVRCAAGGVEVRVHCNRRQLLGLGLQ